jgi:hypothetical protein
MIGERSPVRLLEKLKDERRRLLACAKTEMPACGKIWARTSSLMLPAISASAMRPFAVAVFSEATAIERLALSRRDCKAPREARAVLTAFTALSRTVIVALASDCEVIEAPAPVKLASRRVGLEAAGGADVERGGVVAAAVLVGADLELEAVAVCAVEDGGAVELGRAGDAVDLGVEGRELDLEVGAVRSPSRVSLEAWIANSRIRARTLCASPMAPSAVCTIEMPSCALRCAR